MAKWKKIWSRLAAVKVTLPLPVILVVTFAVLGALGVLGVKVVRATDAIEEVRRRTEALEIQLDELAADPLEEPPDGCYEEEEEPQFLDIHRSL